MTGFDGIMCILLGDVAHGRVWVPNRSSTSCGLGIFMYQPTESVAASKVWGSNIGFWA